MAVRKHQREYGAETSDWRRAFGVEWISKRDCSNDFCHPADLSRALIQLETRRSNRIMFRGADQGDAIVNFARWLSRRVEVLRVKNDRANQSGVVDPARGTLLVTIGAARPG